MLIGVVALTHLLRVNGVVDHISHLTGAYLTGA